MQQRYPFGVPYGWFPLAYADEVGPGALVAVRAFGEDLVLWRSESGEPVVQTAYCPHLGAHLARGGTVDAETVRCPFHGWRFGRDGHCTAIPYSDRLNRRARLRTYPTREFCGMVMAWHHPHEVTPLWDLPERHRSLVLADLAYDRSTYDIGAAVQDLIENTVDVAHFHEVHRTAGQPELEGYSTDGHTSSMLSRQLFATPRGPVPGRIDVHMFGPGIQVTHLSGVAGAVLLAGFCPVESDRVKVFFNVGVVDGPASVGEAFVRELNRQINEDIPIWESKRYLVQPALALGDGPILEFRRWFAQFYVSATID